MTHDSDLRGARMSPDKEAQFLKMFRFRAGALLLRASRGCRCNALCQSHSRLTQVE